MGETPYTKEQLQYLRSLPLEEKVQISIGRIIQWYNYWSGAVYVSLSGKDSTALLHLVRSIYPDVPAVFSNTGLEYPEIQAFARRKENVVIIRPEKRFDEVLTEYGYPLISKENAEAIYYARRKTGKTPPENEPNYSDTERKRAKPGSVRYRRRQFTGVHPSSTTDEAFKKSLFNKERWLPMCRDLPVRISHKCCNVMKKQPLHEYAHRENRVPIIGTLTEESRLRKQSWLRHGCNAFDGAEPSSQPLSFWTEQDVLMYIKTRGLEIASVYGDIVSVDKDGFEYDSVVPGCKLKTTGCQRTGCVYCPFGMHLEKGETRFQRLARTHPKQYDFCMRGGQWIDNPDYDPTDTGEPDEMGWVNWNPKKLWIPGNGGLGMRRVFDMVNEIYGKDFYRYD